MAKILVTTTSFQDTPGPHHDKLKESGHEIVFARGPLPEDEILDLVGDLDGMICGDDAITRKVIEKARPKLRILSKYGIGVDKIDVEAATELGIPVLFTPGVNHTTVAEHTFGLLIGLAKNIVEEANYVSQGNWKRLVGHEIMGKTIAIIGMGRIGKEVAKRAKAFAMNIIGYDIYWDDNFAKEYFVERVENLDDILSRGDIISLHVNLSPETENLIDAKKLEIIKNDAIILNCARGELVDAKAVADALEAETLGGYGSDVLDQEPPPADHPLLKAKNCIITPHIGSRTHESVQRQAGMALENLLLTLDGKKPLAQVNDVPIPQP